MSDDSDDPILDARPLDQTDDRITARRTLDETGREERGNERTRPERAPELLEHDDRVGIPDPDPALACG